jgi:hypothetical protein
VSYGKVTYLNVAPTLSPPFTGPPIGSMASHAAASAGHAVAVAAPWLAGAAAAAGAVLLTRAALGGMIKLADGHEARTEELIRQRRDERVWQYAYADVLARNTRITRLGRQAAASPSGAGPAPTLPDPLDPAAAQLDLAAIQAWCRTADAALDRAGEQLAARRRAAALRPLPADEAAEATAEAALLGWLAERAAGRPEPGVRDVAAAAPAAATFDAATRHEYVRYALDELWVRVDLVSADDFRRLVASAGALLEARTESECRQAQSALWDELEKAVDRQDARSRDADRAAPYVATLTGMPGPLPPEAGAVLARLEAVVAEREPLTEQLDQRARQVLRQLNEDSERTYQLQVLTGVLGELGYQVDAGDAAGLRVTHPDLAGWSATARLENGQLHADVPADVPPELVRLWAADHGQLIDTLRTHLGVDPSGTRVFEPVEQPAPERAAPVDDEDEDVRELRERTPE